MVVARRSPQVVVSVRLPREVVELLDELVRRGEFSSRSEAVQEGVMLLLRSRGLLRYL